jgi:hypothetical protein
MILPGLPASVLRRSGGSKFFVVPQLDTSPPNLVFGGLSNGAAFASSTLTDLVELASA